MNTEKYVWFENHEEEIGFTVAHKENDTETIIAVTDTTEKAQLIAAALNQYTEPPASFEKTGIDLIAEERIRQIEVEAYTAHKDDIRYEHSDPLASAGAAYAMAELYRRTTSPGYDNTPHCWPFGKHFWKPSPGNRVRELVKAGALIAAAIDFERRKDK